MRALLRPASSPWIVFDRDSRVDDFAKSALRVGAVFASSPSLVADLGASTAAPAATIMTKDANAVLPSAPTQLALPPPQATARMFPESPASMEPALEPSSVVSTTDVVPAPMPIDAARPLGMPSLTELPEGLRPRPVGRYAAWIAAVAAGILLVSGGLAASARSAKHARATAAKAARVQAAKAPPPPPAPLQPAPPPAPVEVTPAPTLPPATATAAGDDKPAPHPEASAAVVGAEATDPKKRWGRLTIKADGKTQNVWFDGKRMLGSGTRSFMVFCGMHTIAINDKIDTKDVEIPCNGEYVASK